MQSSVPRTCHPPARRSGFTLVELLIVITIIVILLAMTISLVNFSRDADRVSQGAAQIKSFLAGARDRAIYAKKPRGVRFFLDPQNIRAVSTMAYIDPAEAWTDGVIQLQRWDFDVNGVTDPALPNLDINGDGIMPDDPTEVWVVFGAGTGWWELKRRGMLFDGMTITIGDYSGPVITSLIDVTVPPTAVQRLILARPYRDPGDTPVTRAKAFESGGPENYSLELPPRILPEEPSLLPQATVIDLDGSKVPGAWRPSASTGGVYSQYMDIVYSPRGNIIGTAASAGVIHLYVCDNEDSLALKEQFIQSLDPTPAVALAIFNNLVQSSLFVPADQLDVVPVPWLGSLAAAGKPYLTKDRRIVSIFSQTGAVSVHPVAPTDLTPLDGFADDPFYFAETGETAN